jgi:hypothetical protein
MSNLEYIQSVVSARFGGPDSGEATADLTPREREALQSWSNRLTRIRTGQYELALPNGALVWA